MAKFGVVWLDLLKWNLSEFGQFVVDLWAVGAVGGMLGVRGIGNFEVNLGVMDYLVDDVIDLVLSIGNVLEFFAFLLLRNLLVAFGLLAASVI